MLFTEEQTNRYLEPLRQEFLDHHREPNAPYTQEVMNLVRTEALQQQSIWRREPIEGEEKNYVRQMVTAIRNFAPNIGEKLTDGIMTKIIGKIREIFPDAEHCTLDVFRNKHDKGRVIEICDWVQCTLSEKLHLKKKPSLSVVSRIIHLVVDAVPIITNSLKKCLHSLGYLRHRYTEKIAEVLDAIGRFLYENDFILEMAQYVLPVVGKMTGNESVTMVTSFLISALCKMVQHMYNNQIE